jgi:hypothetical protein
MLWGRSQNFRFEIQAMKSRQRDLTFQVLGGVMPLDLSRKRSIRVL